MTTSGGQDELGPVAVRVYQNRVCHVDRLPFGAGWRTVRTEDGHVLGTYVDPETGLALATRQANQYAGPVRPPRNR